MNPKSHSPAIRALTEREGRSLREIASDYAARGYSRVMAAEELGVGREVFRHALRRECPDVEWTGYSLRQRAAKPRTAERLRRTLRESGRAITFTAEGREWTLAEAAERVGITPQGMLRRYRRGLRGSEMLAPARPTGTRPKVYEIGLSVHELQIVLRHEQRHGIRSAVAKFGLPWGAIGAMKRGEWERVA